MIRNLLTIKAEADAGMHLEDVCIPMVELAKRTGCRVELKANGITIWANPDDDWWELRNAFRRLYPAEKFISVNIANLQAARPKGDTGGG